MPLTLPLGTWTSPRNLSVARNEKLFCDSTCKILTIHKLLPSKNYQYNYWKREREREGERERESEWEREWASEWERERERERERKRERGEYWLNSMQEAVDSLSVHSQQHLLWGHFSTDFTEIHSTTATSVYIQHLHLTVNKNRCKLHSHKGCPEKLRVHAVQ